MPRDDYLALRDVVGVPLLHTYLREEYDFSTIYVGGVNHCRLVKSRGLMRRGKYGTVIGQKMRFFVCAQYELPGCGFLFTQSQRPLFIKPRDFAKRQWLTPPTYDT